MGTPAAPYPVNPEVIQAVSIAYRNNKLIADSVMPRVPVGTKDFKYRAMNLADNFTVQDTKIGRTSQPNRVEVTGNLVSASCVDYGLDDAIPLSDLETAAPGVDPVATQTEFVTGLVALDREIRVAATVFNTANHANKATLSGTSQWSDYTNSDPISAIMSALDTCLMRPNQMVIGRLAFTKLAMHPKVCKAIFGNNTDAGIVTRAQIAALLELDEVLVGEGFANTAKRGQTASMSRVWGKHAAFLYRETPTATQTATTWGFSAEFGERTARTYFDDKIGLKGGQVVVVGESLGEVVSAPDLSYFFQNCVD